MRICLPVQGKTGSGPGLGRSHMPRSNWAREPRLLSLRVWSLCSAMGRAAIVKGPRTAVKSGPRLPQLEKALTQKRRPNTAKIKKIKIKKKSPKAEGKGSFGYLLAMRELVVGRKITQSRKKKTYLTI